MGPIVAVVGPSGVGKDTVMQGLARMHPWVRLARRVITRPVGSGGEDFDGVSEAEFQRRLLAGDFALHWQAHGLHYGIPRAIAALRKAGHPVLFNGSRAMLHEARRVFPDLRIAHITTRVEVLAARLAARGRETADDIAARLERAALPLPADLPVLEIDNSGAPEAAIRALAALVFDQAPLSDDKTHVFPHRCDTLKTPVGNSDTPK